MIKEWIFKVPEGYTKTFKGFSKGQVGPVKAELANEAMMSYLSIY